MWAAEAQAYEPSFAVSQDDSVESRVDEVSEIPAGTLMWGAGVPSSHFISRAILVLTFLFKRA